MKILNLKSRPQQIGLLLIVAAVISVLLLAFGNNNKTEPYTQRASQQPPAKTEAADYTRFVVDQAIDRYENDGLDATLAHYNDSASIDDQWYIFVIDKNDTIVGHYDPTRLGQDVNGPVGTDLNGFVFGQQMLAADEDGAWVSYIYTNPASGQLDDQASFEFKNAWVVRHDDLLFGSGWYINTDEFTPQLINQSAERFRQGGLEALLAFYGDPLGVSSGIIPAAEYYNSTDTLAGFFSGFSAGPDGQILIHINPDLIGTDLEDLLGPAVLEASADGGWITADDNPDGVGPETMRVYVISVDGTIIGAGWYSQD